MVTRRKQTSTYDVNFYGSVRTGYPLSTVLSVSVVGTGHLEDSVTVVLGVGLRVHSFTLEINEFCDLTQKVINIGLRKDGLYLYPIRKRIRPLFRHSTLRIYISHLRKEDTLFLRLLSVLLRLSKIQKSSVSQ